jgi:hypothetical protein
MTKHDWDAEPQFQCFEQDQLPHGTEIYEDVMIDGSPYQILVKVNGRSLPPDKQRRNKENCMKRSRKAMFLNEMPSVIAVLSESVMSLEDGQVKTVNKNFLIYGLFGPSI